MADCKGTVTSSEDFHENKAFTESAMSDENRPPPVNRITASRADSYWFAQGGVDEEASSGRNNPKCTETKEAQLQKEREERIRLFREQQEEERIRRLKELEQSFEVSKKHREQQEEERRRKIEEARIRENERRQQVEERKRQIWEAEQERKEAILRRNLEREARIEARRNAQRNSMSFAFGSSTPRTFDLDLAALGTSALGCSLMSSVSARRSEEKEVGVKRATSACSLDRKAGDDCMSRSMISLSSASRGRRRTDLTPVMPRERSMTPHTVPRGNAASLRAVSMTRLDQLAQPRRRFLESPRDNSSTATTVAIGPRTVSPSMSKSMCNLANAPPPKRLVRVPMSHNQNMSRSMLHLPGNNQNANQGYSTKHSVSPTSPPYYNKPLTGMRSAQSMTHLAIAPRLTRAARLRADALTNARQDGKTTSMMNLHKSDSHYPGKLSGKDGSRSPSRPQSSMSGRSEVSGTSSQASSVSMRPKPPPRKPRPVSIAGTTVDRLSLGLSNALSKQVRPMERNAVPPPGPKPVRTKSSDFEIIAKNQPIKKPIPPPKSAQVLAKAKSHPVLTKDNLRKQGVKVSGESKKDLPNASEPAPQAVPLSDADNKPVNVQQTADKEMEIPISKPSESAEVKTDQPPNGTGVDIVSPANTEDKSEPEREMSPEVKSECEMSPKVKSEREMSPKIKSEREMSPKVKSEREMSPKVKPEREMSPKVKPEREMSPKVKSEHERETSPKVILERERAASPKIKSERAREASPKVKSERVREASPKVKSEREREMSPNEGTSVEAVSSESAQTKARITSEEEAKAALAEKRRLAREQAEREAELERQRQEELRRQEEERRLKEELEQKRLEEEQIRLAELHRKLEEEKLQKAIEEQQQREKEEKARKEEEARLRMEREEQDRKAREEAERQRIELEEKLRREEQERAERKKRVEQIMSRTRNKGSAANNKPTSSPANETASPSGSSTPNQLTDSAKSNSSHVILNNTVSESSISNSNSSVSTTQVNAFGTSVAEPMNLDILMTNSNVKNGYHGDSIDSAFLKSATVSSANCVPNRTPNSEAVSPLQTNGYSSHEEMSITSSPEDRSEKSDSSGGLLLDLQSNHPPLPNVIARGHTDQLIDIGMSTNSSNDNYLIHPDVVNSNLVSNDPFHAFESNLPKKQETTITDLLS